MKILVACEESQEVTMAYRKKGYEAWSCDIQKSSGDMPQYHIEEDCLKHAYSGKYDMMIAFPPCTYLATIGTRWLYHKGKFNQERYEKSLEALEFVRLLMEAPIKHICIENPISIISSHIKKPTQIINPYQFGHLECKKTCFWLKNIPPLKDTNNVYSEMMKLPYKKRHKIFMKLYCKKERSKTYRGIAHAMASQWIPENLFEQLTLFN